MALAGGSKLQGHRPGLNDEFCYACGVDARVDVRRHLRGVEFRRLTDAVLDGADIAYYTCVLCLESTRQPGDVQPMVIDDVSTMLVREPDKEVRLETRGISVDRRDRVVLVTWRCRSSSTYGGTEVDKVLCVMTASLYWMDVLLDRQPLSH